MDGEDPALLYTSIGYAQRVTVPKLLVANAWYQILPADPSRWSVIFWACHGDYCRVFPGFAPVDATGLQADVGWRFSVGDDMPTITFRDWPAVVGNSWWGLSASGGSDILALETYRLRG